MEARSPTAGAGSQWSCSVHTHCLWSSASPLSSSASPDLEWGCFPRSLGGNLLLSDSGQKAALLFIVFGPAELFLNM